MFYQESGVTTIVLEVLLWGAVGAIVYSYLCYPGIVFIIALFKRQKPDLPECSQLPNVSVIVSCYNEQSVLPSKLENIKSYEYSPSKIEYLFGSDGSTDRTSAILRNAAQSGSIKFYDFSERRGKAAVLNDLVTRASHEIVVFTDANTMFEPTTIQSLVRPFNDARVGAVCGNLILLNRDEPSGRSEESYWSYENWLKQKESDLSTALGASGGVYAIRRDLYVPLPRDRSVTDDFLTPIQIVKLGYRVKYSRDAKAFEEVSGSTRREFERKARIGAQNFSGISEFSSLLLPKAGFVSFALWSHKIVRWVVPHLALIAFLATLALSFGSPFYLAFLGLQVTFILLALLGAVADVLGFSVGVLYLPYYIVAMNVALFIGFWRFALGRQNSTWEVSR